MLLLQILRIRHANRSPRSLRNVKEIPLKSFFSFFKIYNCYEKQLFVRRIQKLILVMKYCETIKLGGGKYVKTY